MIKKLTSLLGNIVGRIDKDMITSFFMTLGSVMIPVAFLLIITSYELGKPVIWFWAVVAFVIGLASLLYSFRRALKEERDILVEKRKLDKNSADRHSEMKTLLQGINTNLKNLKR